MACAEGSGEGEPLSLRFKIEKKLTFFSEGWPAALGVDGSAKSKRR
jgi:hypothetical protein